MANKFKEIKNKTETIDQQKKDEQNYIEKYLKISDMVSYIIFKKNDIAKKICGGLDKPDSVEKKIEDIILNLLLNC